MDDVKWRTETEVLAGLDIMSTTLVILVVLLYACSYMAAFALKSKKTDAIPTTESGKPTVVKTDEAKAQEKLAVGLMLNRSGCIIVVAVLQLCFAIHLLSATKTERDCAEAVLMSKFWLYFNIAFLCFWFTCAFVAGVRDYIFGMIWWGWICVRAVLFYLVWSRVYDLDCELGST